LNKKWELIDIGRDMWDLIFCPYYYDEIIATIYRDDEGDWRCTSKLLKMKDDFIDYEYVTCDNIKNYISDRIKEFYIDEINSYKELLELFEEE